MNWDNFLRYARETRSLLVRERRSDDPTLRFFWWIVAAQAIFWSILPAIFQPNVSSETLELLAAGRQFAWGYPTQPPLGVWAASVLTSISAPSIWPLYLLSQLCAVVSVWCAWTLGRRFLQPWTAVCAALVLLTGFSFTISSGSFTGAHLATMFWSLAILAFHEAFTNPRRRYWVLTGVALGLGLLSSYGTVILFLAMGSFMLFDRRARRCWDSSWWMLSLVSLGLITVNHLWWLMAHDFVTLASTFAASPTSQDSLLRRFAYVGGQAIGFFLICLLLNPVARRVNIVEAVNSEENDQEFTRVYLTWLTALPAAVILVLSLFADPASGAMSGVCLWVYLGVLLLMWSRLDERRLAWRQAILRTGAAAGFLAAVFIAQQVMLPSLTQRADSTLFPGSELARNVQAAWARSGATEPLPLLVGAPQLVRNAGWYAPSGNVPVLNDAQLLPSSNHSLQQAAWHEELVKTGGVVLWEANDDDTQTVNTLHAALGQQRVAVSVLNPMELAWQTTAQVKPVRVAMAVVRPANRAAFEVAPSRQVIPVNAANTNPGNVNPVNPVNPPGNRQLNPQQSQFQPKPQQALGNFEVYDPNASTLPNRGQLPPLQQHPPAQQPPFQGNQGNSNPRQANPSSTLGQPGQFQPPVTNNDSRPAWMGQPVPLQPASHQHTVPNTPQQQPPVQPPGNQLYQPAQNPERGTVPVLKNNPPDQNPQTSPVFAPTLPNPNNAPTYPQKPDDRPPQLTNERSPFLSR